MLLVVVALFGDSRLVDEILRDFFPKDEIERMCVPVSRAFLVKFEWPVVKLDHSDI